MGRLRRLRYTKACLPEREHAARLEHAGQPFSSAHNPALSATHMFTHTRNTQNKHTLTMEMVQHFSGA